MNLLAYTKKLSEMIAYYDDIAKRDFFGMTNPFHQDPINITIIWVHKNAIIILKRYYICLN